MVWVDSNRRFIENLGKCIGVGTNDDRHKSLVSESLPSDGFGEVSRRTEIRQSEVR